VAHLYFEARVEEETLKKVVWHSVATALANMVLPVPGGPNMRTPCDMHPYLFTTVFAKALCIGQQYPSPDNTLTTESRATGNGFSIQVSTRGTGTLTSASLTQFNVSKLMLTAVAYRSVDISITFTGRRMPWK